MKNKNNNRQGFINHVDTIKNIEHDKDEFLKASRLERHESKKAPLTPSNIITLVAMLCGTVIVCTMLVVAYMNGQVTPAIIGIMFLVFMGIMVAAGLSD